MTPSPTAPPPSAEAMEVAHRLAFLGKALPCGYVRGLESRHSETCIDIARAIDAAIAKEREECAKVADPDRFGGELSRDTRNCLLNTANLIRDRGRTP